LSERERERKREREREGERESERGTERGRGRKGEREKRVREEDLARLLLPLLASAPPCKHLV